MPDMDNLPRKSIVAPKTDPEKIQPVVKGKVSVYKKSLGRKFQETFLGSDFHTAFDYVKKDVLVPTIKTTLYNIVMGTLSMMLFNKPNGSAFNAFTGGTQYINYNKISTSNVKPSVPTQPQYAKPNTQFVTPLFEHKYDADEVLMILKSRIETYGRVSISDVYDACNMVDQDVFTANQFGWTNLNMAAVSRVPSGWIINFPPIDRIM